MHPRTRPATQGRVGADFGAHDRGHSQRAGLGRPHDDDYTRDRRCNTRTPDNMQIDHSLEQVSPLGDRYGQRHTNMDSELACTDSSQCKCATCDVITASIIRSSKR
jgi:hypothetical protein